jgi:galactokinase
MGPSPRTRIELYYSSRFEAPPQGIVFMPGRVVLLGEHVDHQGGRILAAPTAQGVYVAWGIRPDHRIRLHALNARGTDRFDPGVRDRSGRRWSDLARGAFARFTESGRRVPGLDLAVFGDLPAQAGLASSAAYTAAIVKAVLDAIGEPLDPAELARHVAAVEREWAGVACGFMDPYVAAVARPGDVVWLDNRTLTHETLALPPGTRLDHANTGIARRLSETPYNERRHELAHALARLRELEPDLTSLVDLTPERFASLADRLDEPYRRRARHVVTEADRVQRGAAALQAGDAAQVGALMQECHASLADDFECSLPEIDAQVARLEAEDDVLGVRLQGAGWGGSLAVLRTTQA